MKVPALVAICLPLSPGQVTGVKTVLGEDVEATMELVDVKLALGGVARLETVALVNAAAAELWDAALCKAADA